MTRAKVHKIRYCGFCGDNEQKASVLVAGCDTHICDECVLLAVRIIAERPSDLERAKGFVNSVVKALEEPMRVYYKTEPKGEEGKRES